jgi:hypothetical protein
MRPMRLQQAEAGRLLRLRPEAAQRMGGWAWEAHEHITRAWGAAGPYEGLLWKA